MVRILDSKIILDGPGRNDIRCNDYSGLSTDQKPTDSGIATGSTFLEVDTGDAYLYDEVGGTWHKVGGSNG